MEVVERPIIEVTSSEQKNGRYRVQIDIKGFEKFEQPVTNLNSNHINNINMLPRQSTTAIDLVQVDKTNTAEKKIVRSLADMKVQQTKTARPTKVCIE